MTSTRLSQDLKQAPPRLKKIDETFTVRRDLNSSNIQGQLSPCRRHKGSKRSHKYRSEELPKLNTK